MTDLTPSAALSPVVQLETTDLALGGTGNPMNRQAQALLNRDAFRAAQISDNAAAASAALDATDTLRADLEDPVGAGGGDHVFYEGRSISDRFLELPHAQDFGADGDGVVDNVAPFTSASASGSLTFIPTPTVGYSFSAPLDLFAGTWLPDPGQTWDQLTDGGNFNMFRGRTTGGVNGANIWRLSDRLFIGGAASNFAGNDTAALDGGTSWLSDNTTAPSYLGVNAGVLFTSEGADPLFPTRNSPYGIVSGGKSSVAGQGTISFGAAVVNDLAGATSWAFIAELQREAGSANIYGFEISAKNKGSNGVATPNTLVSGGPGGVYGIWAAGGGDPVFGGASVNPSTAALVVLNNSNTWNTGIVMAQDALTNGEAIALSSEGIGGAHAIKWYDAAGNVVFNLQSSASDAVNWVMNRSNTGLAVSKAGGAVFTISGPATPVNGLTVFGSAAGVQPQLIAAGTDTNIDLQLTPKGTGRVRFGAFVASGDVAVVGSIEIKDAGGTIRKLAVVA